MLKLRRRNGSWVEVTHVESGEVCRIQVTGCHPGGCDLLFEDDPRNFRIEREERLIARAAAEAATQTVAE